MAKTNNIFNYLKTDPENLDEKTIYENTGVNADKVKEITMNKIHGVKSAPKKNRKKTITLSLIAAAAAAAVLGTTAAAAGTFNSIFGQWFAGEAPNGAYTGGNVKVNSDTLNIDFGGVAGDEHSAYSIMTITKKDGSAFVEDSQNVLCINPSDVFGDEYDPTVTVSHSLFENIFGGKTEFRNVMNYYFEDDGTMKATVSIHDEYKNMIGSTMYIKETHVNVFRVDEIIYTKEEFEKIQELPENDEFWSDGLGIWEKAEKEYEKRTGHSLAENQSAMFDFDEKGMINNIVIAHYDTIDLPYDISVQLNYKDTSVSLDSMTDKKINIDGDETTITEFTVTPFSMYIKTHMDHKNTKAEDELSFNYHKDFGYYLDKDLGILAIRLDNGETYYADIDGYGSNGGDDHFDEEYSYLDFRDGNKIAMINPSKIVSITYKDKTLYHA